MYEASKQSGRASLVYPGNGVVSGPNLVCGTFIPNLPPEAIPFFGPILDGVHRDPVPAAVESTSLLGAPTPPLRGPRPR